MGRRATCPGGRKVAGMLGPVQQLAWRLGAAVLIVAVAGCGSSSAPPSDPATAPASSTARTPTATSAPTSAASPLPALKLLWEKSGPGQPSPCCQTWSPAIDPKTGEIWVANSFADQYWIFSPDGTFKEAWGTPGTAPGQLDMSAHRNEAQAAGGIAFGPDGSFYVADTGNHRVQHFGADRRLIKAWGSFGSGDGHFAEPFAVGTDGRTVFVADGDRGDIQAFAPDGTFIRAIGPIMVDAGIFVAVDANGTLYRSAGMDRPGALLVYSGGSSSPRTIELGDVGGFTAGLTIDAQGDV